MSRGLHYSLLFWAGLFGALCLAWAWCDSFYHDSRGRTATTPELMLQSAQGCFFIRMDARGPGSFSISREKITAWPPNWWEGFEGSLLNFIPRGSMEPPSWRNGLPAYLLVTLPYWLIFPVYVSVWLLVLGMRAVKVRKMMEHLMDGRRLS